MRLFQPPAQQGTGFTRGLEVFTLHGSYGSASFAPHAVLEICVQDYQLIDVDLSSERSPDYLALNPTGRVPTLVESDGKSRQVMTESSAMCVYLADRFRAANLSPAIDAAQRRPYLQWMAFLSTSLQETYLRYYYPERTLSAGMNGAPVRQAAEGRLETLYEILQNELGSRRFMLGDELSTCDIYLLMLMAWHEDRDRLFSRFPGLAGHFDRVLGYPEIAKVFRLHDVD
jgi:glutathione S-transferase